MTASHSETPGSDARGFSFALVEGDGGLQLVARHHPRYAPLILDWTGAAIRRRIGAGRGQLLGRAIGLHKMSAPRVLDATAGLGRDGFTLAALGAEVTLVERQPLLAALLRDALASLHGDPAWADVAGRLRLVEAEARQVLRSGERWDVVHLDPMYPHRGKDALPQKEMQILRELCGADADAHGLLAPALAACRQRVVVKRPLHAEFLDGRAPAFQLRGKQARYDVYVPATAAEGQTTDRAQPSDPPCAC
ncbi:class I SAM-dependent methyltransferase [Fontimonas sp. SYSU GA230001]|uniref:class I SAM-dependent methyltransferase n=1 Tax=Fontimonas sp. SYSU GA230001 TaxID=3142450 RepID=UPI0032B605ED